MTNEVSNRFGPLGLRRTVALVAVVALLVVTAGCLGILSSSDDRSAQADVVPADADFLVHVDMGVLTDGEAQQLFETASEEDMSEGFDDMDEALAEIEDEFGLDPRAVDNVLVFGSMAADLEYGGAVVDTSWDVEDVVSAIEADEGIEYELTEHAGQDVLYEPTEVSTLGDPLYVGELEDGQLVFGDEHAVTGALDVSYDGADALSGPVRDAFDDSPSGYVTFAAGTPDELVPGADPMADDDPMAGGDPMMGGGMGDLGEIEAVAGAIYTSSGNVGIEARAIFSDSSTAGEMAEMIEGVLPMLAMDDPELAEQLDKLDVSTSGSALVVTFETPVDELFELEDEF